MAQRTLRFTISSALVAAPLALGVACGGGEAEEPQTNVTAGDEQPHTNVHPEHEHEDGDPATNPAVNSAPEEELEPVTNPAPTE